MQWIVAFGVAMSLAGLAGIVWSIFAVRRERAKTQTDEDLRAALQKILPINIGALMLSVLGLGAVSIGLILGA